MAFCYFTSPFFLKYYKSQYNSFKIVFDLDLIKAIDLHERHRIKISFIKKEDVHTLNPKKLKNHTFSIVKGTFPLALSV